VKRLFIVFAFENEKNMKRFSESKNMDLVAERKLAEMQIQDEYLAIDVIRMLESKYSYCIVYELIDVFDMIAMGISVPKENAS